MDTKTALDFVDELVPATTGQHLNDLQRTIFQETWEGSNYKHISAKHDYSEGHVRATGAKLWKLISESLEEEVTFTNFRSAIERKWKLRQTEENPGLLTFTVRRPKPNLSDSKFIGREKEEEELSRLFYQEGNKVILIKAGAGYGKSTLAEHFLETKCQKYIRINMGMQSGDIKPAEETVKKILEDELGVSPSPYFQANLELLEAKLSEPNISIGIHVDNLEPALDKTFSFREGLEGYTDFLEVLNAKNINSLTLITSRRTLITDKIVPIEYPLPGLSELAWQEYFRDCDGQEVLAEIHQAFNGNAKVMDIIYGLVKQRFNGDIAKCWQVYKDALLANPTLDHLISLEVNWLEENQPEVYTLLCRMGCYRYQDIPTIPYEGLLDLLWDTEQRQSLSIVECLLNHSLVDGDYNSGFYLHPAVREKAVEELQKDSEIWFKTNRAIASFYLSRKQVVNSFEAVIHLKQIGDFSECCTVLLNDILESETSLINLRCHSNLWKKAPNIIRLYEDIVKQDIDISLSSLVCIPLTIACAFEGKNQKAIEIANKQLEKIEFYPDFSSNIKYSQILLNVAIGRAYKLIGNFNKAEHYCQEASKLSQRYGNTTGKALALYELGLVMLDLGHPGRACPCIVLAAFLAVGINTIPGKLYSLLKTPLKDLLPDIRGYVKKYDPGTPDGNTTKQLGVLCHLSEAFFQMKKYKVANFLVNIAEGYLLPEFDMERTWIMCIYARNYQMLGDGEKAKELYQEVHKRALEDPVNMRKVIDLLECARWYFDQKEYDKCLEINQVLEKDLDLTEFERAKAENYQLSAEVLKLLSQEEKAANYERKATAIFDTLEVYT